MPEKRNPPLLRQRAQLLEANIPETTILPAIVSLPGRVLLLSVTVLQPRTCQAEVPGAPEADSVEAAVAAEAVEVAAAVAVVAEEDKMSR